MRLRLGLPCALLGVGCKDFGEKIEDYTNPTVIEAMVLGVGEPDFEFDLSATDFNKGAAALVFLADAQDADEIENAPIAGAKVNLANASTGSLKLKETTDGQYSATGDDGLVYAVGEDFNLTIETEDGEATTMVTGPAAASADIPSTHTSSTKIDVDLSGQAFNSALIVVFDATTGTLTYSNEPDTVGEIYEFTHGGDGEELTYTIPASAFPDATLYAVGIAGMKNASEDDFDGANTLLSSFIAGKMKFWPVYTQ